MYPVAGTDGGVLHKTANERKKPVEHSSPTRLSVPRRCDSSLPLCLLTASLVLLLLLLLLSAPPPPPPLLRSLGRCRILSLISHTTFSSWRCSSCSVLQGAWLCRGEGAEEEEEEEEEDSGRLGLGVSEGVVAGSRKTTAAAAAALGPQCWRAALTETTSENPLGTSLRILLGTRDSGRPLGEPRTAAPPPGTLLCRRKLCWRGLPRRSASQAPSRSWSWG